MDIISYNESGYLPGIILDKERGIYTMSGKACPEDPVEFYQPIFDWLDNYIENPSDEMIFQFKMIYYNTATSKVLMMILQKLEEVADNGTPVKVKWYYPEDDEDMFEAGEDYSEMVELDFELISVDE